MSNRPWYKCYPSDFLNGISELNPHEIAVYTVVLMRMYDEGGPIPHDKAKIARRCNMRTAQCGKALTALIHDGKLRTTGGMLTNARAEKEIAARNELISKQSANARSRWQRASENASDINASTMPSHVSGTARAMPIRSQSPDSPESIESRERAISNVSLESKGNKDFAVHMKCAELAGIASSPNGGWNFVPIDQWLADGADPERHIYPALRDVMARRAGPPASLNYFTKAVMAKKAQAGDTMTLADGTVTSRAKWRREVHALANPRARQK